MQLQSVNSDIIREFYVRTVVTTVINEAETWGVKVLDAKEFDFIEAGCLRSEGKRIVLVTVKKEELRLRVGVTPKVSEWTDQKVLKCFQQKDGVWEERLTGII